LLGPLPLTTVICINIGAKICSIKITRGGHMQIIPLFIGVSPKLNICRPPNMLEPYNISPIEQDISTSTIAWLQLHQTQVLSKSTSFQSFSVRHQERRKVCQYTHGVVIYIPEALP
jgi:hypothetical protein